jgi:hypothetical protein
MQFNERPYTRQSIQVQGSYTLVATTENVTIYTVPTGYDLFLKLISAKDGAHTCTSFTWFVTVDATLMQIETTPSIATNTVYNMKPEIYITEGDVIGVRVIGGTIGDVITFNIFGELLAQGQWH